MGRGGWLAGTVKEVTEDRDGKYLYSIRYDEDSVLGEEVCGHMIRPGDSKETTPPLDAVEEDNNGDELSDDDEDELSYDDEDELEDLLTPSANAEKNKNKNKDWFLLKEQIAKLIVSELDEAIRRRGVLPKGRKGKKMTQLQTCVDIRWK